MSEIALEHILVPTDFSESSKVALRYATALADRFGACIHLLHAVQSPFEQPWAAEIYAVSMADFEQTARRESDAALATMLSESERQKYGACPITEMGPPFLTIINYATREPIDLIVMGTHGRGAIAHLLIGSVAENVVRKAPCPVLTEAPRTRVRHTLIARPTVTRPLTIGDVMTCHLWVIGEDAPLRQARSLMVDHGIHHLPVVQEGRCVGVLTDRDVKRALDPDLGLPPEDELFVRDVCVLDVYAVVPSAPLDGVLREMAGRHIGSTLVVEAGRLLGILTTSDVCRVFADFLHSAQQPTPRLP